MRILFILDEFLPENNGGAANIAFGLAKGMIRLDHDLLVLTATYNPEKVGDIEIEGVKIKRILAYSFGRLRNFKNLKNRGILNESEKIIREYHPDVIHIHTLHHRFSYGIIGLAKKLSKAVFLTLHDAQTVFNGKLFPKNDYKITWFDNLKKDKLGYNPLQKFFIKKALKNADKLFAVSNALKKALEANGAGDITVIHNGINFNEWPIDEIQGNNILFIGRVDEAKGANVLIKIMRAINSKIPGANLIIVGDENFKAGDNKNIKILSWQYDRIEVKKIFAKAKVVVVPSLYLDPFPTVNLEAMAAGRPVVGTCFGGTPEVVVDNETGHIVNPYDEKKLIEKIVDLLENHDKAKLFGSNGRKRIEKFFSLEKQIQETLTIYNKSLMKEKQ
ncbi:glycosyltransferase family 4 protein [Patescibacteria group bacterium]|nr:glycosyltransferase family 4 protein [Patescibacteria group bacterium]